MLIILDFFNNINTIIQIENHLLSLKENYDGFKFMDYTMICECAVHLESHLVNIEYCSPKKHY